MAELAVNLAGGMATFLTKCWHAKKEKDTEPGAAPNGGPATPVRDPEVSEGPPSVS